MNKDQCFNLGYITKAHGIKGELIFFLDVDDASVYTSLKSVFVEVNDTLVQFDIEQYRLIPKKQAIVKSSDLHSVEQAQTWVGKKIFLPLDFLPELKGKRFYYHEIPGFEVVDAKKGKIGVAKEIAVISVSELLVVECLDKEILIPVNDSMIEKIDRKNKILYVNCPEGLIDIYLQSGKDNDRDD